MESSLPLSRWPEPYRSIRDWRRVPDHHRRAFGRLLSWALPRHCDPLDPMAVRAFAEELRRSASVGVAYKVLSALGLILMDLRSELRWDWLQTLRRHVGQQGGNPRRSTSGRRRGKLRTVSIPVSHWPEPVRTAWQHALDRGNPADEFGEFADDAGACAHWSENMRKHAERGYSRFLWHLADRGLPPIVTRPAIEVFIRALRQRALSPTSIASYVAGVLRVMVVVHPDGDWDWLRAAHNRLAADARYAPKRKDGRVVHGAALYALGLHLIEAARRERPELVRTAVLFRDGLLFVVLTMAPARASSFRIMKLGEHLMGADDPNTIRFGAHETKEGRPESYPIWPAVRDLIEEYLIVYRPVLAGAYDGPELWLAAGGRPLTYRSFWQAIRVRSLEYLGIALSPHLARDSVALTVSEEAPDSMDLATTLLHHATRDSTAPYRRAASTIAASRAAQRLHEKARHRAARAIRTMASQPPEATDDDTTGQL
jgi:integrase